MRKLTWLHKWRLLISAGEVSWCVMEGERAGRDREECIRTADKPTSPGRQSIFPGMVLKKRHSATKVVEQVNRPVVTMHSKAYIS